MHTRAVVALVLLASCGPTSSGRPDDTGGLPDRLELTDPLSLVEAATVTGDIEVVVGDGDTVEVQPILSTNGDTWDYTQDGDTLTLIPVCANGTEGCSTGFSLVVPVDQALDLTTTSGEAALEATYAGVAEVHTTSGTIQGRSLGAATLTGETDSGAVDLEYDDPPASLTATTVSGPIELNLPGGVYDMEIATNGEVTIGDGIQLGGGPPVSLTSTSGTVQILAE